MSWQQSTPNLRTKFPWSFNYENFWQYSECEKSACTSEKHDHLIADLNENPRDPNEE